MSLRRLLVVQPYIPSYRVPLFNLLGERLSEVGVALTVAAGRPGASQAARGDAASRLNVDVVETTARAIDLRGPQVRWQGTPRLSRRFDGVIYEASAALLDVAAAAMTRRNFGLWGHIDSFVNDAHRLDSYLEGLLLRRAAAVFAYTPRGATAALRLGCQASAVYTLNNTVDTSGLISAVESVNPQAAAARLGIELHPENTFCFIGGIDDSKRPDFMIDVLDRLWSTRPQFRLLVAGSGDRQDAFATAVERGQVLMLGRVDDFGKADLSAVASAVMMPGRVGLVAVESFVLGLPIVTTDWRYHAPEFEYLTPGRDAVVTPDSAEAYASKIESLLDDAGELSALRTAARAKSGQPALEDLVTTYVAGVQHLLG